MPNRYWFLLLAAAAFIFSGCTVGPDYQPPGATLPNRIEAQPTADLGPATLRGPYASIALWWRALRDPTLNVLVERAAASNLDVEAALARVQKSRLEEVAVLGGELPQVGVSAGIAAGSGTERGGAGRRGGGVGGWGGGG